MKTWRLWPAILEMARRKLEGDEAIKSPGTAWYWLKRAEQENLDTSSITQKSLNQLLTEMNDIDVIFLTVVSYDYGGLDLRDIVIPPFFPSWPENAPVLLSDREVRSYQERFKGLNILTDRWKYKAIEDELFERITGINNSVKTHLRFPRPFGMGEEEFIHRNCRYLQAVGQIFPQGRREKWEVLAWKKDALNSLFDLHGLRYVKDIVRCNPLYPSPESQSIFDALTWAKGLAQLPLAALRQLADDYFEKSGSIDKDDFKRADGSSKLKDAPEAYMSFYLAKEINWFADFKEAENRRD